MHLNSNLSPYLPVMWCKQLYKNMHTLLLLLLVTNQLEISLSMQFGNTNTTTQNGVLWSNIKSSSIVFYFQQAQFSSTMLILCIKHVPHKLCLPITIKCRVWVLQSLCSSWLLVCVVRIYASKDHLMMLVVHVEVEARKHSNITCFCSILTTVF